MEQKIRNLLNKETWEIKTLEKISERIFSGALCSFSMKSARKIQIPLPSLKEQEEIVSKLDKFRKITEDFEKEIPKLLKLVEKQCKYYKEEIFKCCYQ